MANDSRERMVRSAASLISSRGVSATSLSDVLADSGAPRGSIYHHFPGGKEQLRDRGRPLDVRSRGRVLRAGTEATPAAVLARFVQLWRQVIVTSDATSGCVVAGALRSHRAGDALMGAARESFRAWETALADRLEQTGLPRPRANGIAIAALAGMEGALILSPGRGHRPATR